MIACANQIHDAPSYDHPCVMLAADGSHMGVGLADEEGNVRGIVFMSLVDSKLFGHMWEEAVNECMRRRFIHGGTDDD